MNTAGGKELCVGVVAIATAVASFVVAAPEEKSEIHAVDLKKKKLGQFFTEKRCWLLPQIKDFIANSNCEIVYDPFAGTGCLLDAVLHEIPEIVKAKGLDIDKSLGWEYNDSLKNIPTVEGAIIVTNPPYISKYSASRKKIGNDLKQYFDVTKYDDVYLLALDKMLEAQKMVVAIIPETFINSSYCQKHKLHSVTILEENPFEDTDTPVVVVCFDSISKEYGSIKVYKNGDYICSLNEVEQNRLFPKNSVKIKFNASSGWLAIRCVDTTDPSDKIHFAFKDEIDYNWERGIKNSSRLLTLVEINVPKNFRKEFIKECNRELEILRKNSHDIVLSPFKGNMKNGVRRRRLDFQTCRAIIEKVYFKVIPQNELFLENDKS